MTILEALRLKDSIVQEIEDLESKIRESNCYIVGTKVHYDAEELYKDLASRKADLVILKTKLINTTLPTYAKKYEIEELNQTINFLTALPTTEGIPNNGFQEAVEYKTSINKISIDESVSKARLRILELRNEIDKFNYTTELI